MKTIISVLALILVGLAPLSAQSTFSPQGQPLHYAWPMTSANAYAANDVDTLPTTASLTSTQLGANIGGATYATITLNVLDSAKLDLYADWAYNGSTSFSNISAFTDSLINTTTTSKVQEYTVRLPGTDRIGGLARHVRFRVAFRAAGQGFTTPTYTAKLHWK